MSTGELQLVNCPACGHKYHRKADKCPGCGRPVPEREDEKKGAVVFIFLVVALLVFGVIWYVMTR